MQPYLLAQVMGRSGGVPSQQRFEILAVNGDFHVRTSHGVCHGQSTAGAEDDKPQEVSRKIEDEGRGEARLHWRGPIIGIGIGIGIWGRCVSARFTPEPTNFKRFRVPYVNIQNFVIAITAGKVLKHSQELCGELDDIAAARTCSRAKTPALTIAPRLRRRLRTSSSRTILISRS